MIRKIRFCWYLLCILVSCISHNCFGEVQNLLNEFEKFKTREERITYVETLSLPETISLGNKIIEKYGEVDAFYYIAECLAPKWKENLTSIPESISLVVRTGNKNFSKLVINNFKNIQGTKDIEIANQILPYFVEFLEKESESEKSKIVLIDITNDWFKFYRKVFITPIYGFYQTDKNFQFIHEQTEVLIKYLKKTLESESTPKEIFTSGSVLLKTIKSMYLDEENVLPEKFKKSEKTNQILKVLNEF